MIRGKYNCFIAKKYRQGQGFEKTRALLWCKTERWIVIMAVLTREQLLSRVNEVIGENNNDDNALSFIEDVSDTYDSLASKDGVNWEEKYKELDNSWREKYRARFFNSSGEEPDTTSNKDDVNDEPEQKPLTYENLFKEEEK